MSQGMPTQHRCPNIELRELVPCVVQRSMILQVTIENNLLVTLVFLSPMVTVLLI